MNIITLAGHLGRDAELRSLPDGKPIASFSIADSQGRDKPTIWWNCTIFGERGAKLAPYLLKGSAVTVAGTVTEREWKDKDGTPRKSLDVRVSEVALQGGRSQEAKPEAPKPAPKQMSTAGSGFDDMDDDLPF